MLVNLTPEFLVRIDLQFLLVKTGERLKLKITLKYLHFDPGLMRWFVQWIMHILCIMATRLNCSCFSLRSVGSADLDHPVKDQRNIVKPLVKSHSNLIVGKTEAGAAGTYSLQSQSEYRTGSVFEWRKSVWWCKFWKVSETGTKPDDRVNKNHKTEYFLPYNQINRKADDQIYANPVNFVSFNTG